jgi:hypothetical protein
VPLALATGDYSEGAFLIHELETETKHLLRLEIGAGVEMLPDLWQAPGNATEAHREPNLRK